MEFETRMKPALPADQATFLREAKPATVTEGPGLSNIQRHARHRTGVSVHSPIHDENKDTKLCTLIPKFPKPLTL